MRFCSFSDINILIAQVYALYQTLHGESCCVHSDVAASQGIAPHNVMDWPHQDLSLFMLRAIVLCKPISTGTNEIIAISRSSYAVHLPRLDLSHYLMQSQMGQLTSVARFGAVGDKL